MRPSCPVGSRYPSRRAGFSLIELLINLAIVASLIGIALPFYQGYVYDAQRSKSYVDLETYRSAVLRYESKEGHYSVGDFSVLLGSYMSELSVDPWGNAYFIDGGLGVVGTFGADGLLWGEDEEADLTRHYKPYLIPLDFNYYGGSGIPDADNRLEVRFNKIYDFYLGMRDEAPNDILLIKGGDVLPIPLGQLGFIIDPQRTKPMQGVLALKCCSSPNPNDVFRVSISAEDKMDLAGFVVSFTETPVYPSPLWETPDDYILGPKPATGHENRSGLNIKIVRF